MKYIKDFKTFEAIIVPKELNLNNRRELRNFQDALEFANENDFDLVKYEEFYESLPEHDKLTAPNKDARQPFFALFHPTNRKPMFVINDEEVFRFLPMLNIMDDIIKHEFIHAEQTSKRKDLEYILPNPNIKKDYFSDKDEIMAFSFSIANDLIKEFDKAEEAMNHLLKFEMSFNVREQWKHLWNNIINSVDEKTLKRYKKYIYLYLKEFENKNK